MEKAGAFLAMLLGIILAALSGTAILTSGMVFPLTFPFWLFLILGIVVLVIGIVLWATAQPDYDPSS